jgi:hypothetical protein
MAIPFIFAAAASSFNSQQTTVARTDQIFNNDYILSFCKNLHLVLTPVFLASANIYKGYSKLSATSIPIPIAPVATPAITSQIGSQ